MTRCQLAYPKRMQMALENRGDADTNGRAGYVLWHVILFGEMPPPSMAYANDRSDKALLDKTLTAFPNRANLQAAPYWLHLGCPVDVV